MDPPTNIVWALGLCSHTHIDTPILIVLDGSGSHLSQEAHSAVVLRFLFGHFTSYQTLTSHNQAWFWRLLIGATPFSNDFFGTSASGYCKALTKVQEHQVTCTANIFKVVGILLPNCGWATSVRIQVRGPKGPWYYLDAKA